MKSLPEWRFEFLISAGRVYFCTAANTCARRTCHRRNVRMCRWWISIYFTTALLITRARDNKKFTIVIINTNLADNGLLLLFSHAVLWSRRHVDNIRTEYIICFAMVLSKVIFYCKFKYTSSNQLLVQTIIVYQYLLEEPPIGYQTSLCQN